MKGIISYGAYVPYRRLQRSKIKEFFGTPVFSGEKAVAGFDEDSISMGVEAALDCLGGLDKEAVDAIYFATTSGPYREKSSVPTMVKALDLKESVQGIEAAHSLRAGTSAMIGADLERRTLVIAADCRIGGPGGQNEQLFGDGAAAFLLGSGEDVIARIVDSVTIQEEAVGQWRSQGDPFLQNWEERFVSDVFLQSVQEAAVRLAARNELTPESIAKIVVSGPGSKAYIQAARKLGCKEEQIQDPLLLSAGAAGAAHGPMMLTAALEEAKPHDKILLLTFGEGADAILLEATEAITEYPKRKGIKGHISIKNNELSYSDYVKWKGMLQVEPPRRPATNRPSAPAMYRNYHQNLGFYGSRCTECGTPQFPKQRVCVQCQAKDKMEDYRFIGKKASVATYTVDYLAATPAPPALVAVIDFEGGGRIMCEVTDCSPEEVEIGMEVEMTFRRLYEAGGIHNYFWKARPKR